MKGSIVLLVSPPGYVGTGLMWKHIFEAAGFQYSGEFFAFPRLSLDVDSGINWAFGVTPSRLEQVLQEIKNLELGATVYEAKVREISP
jgi:hypothetical protein